MNSATNEIAGYSISTGTLTALSGSPYTPASPLLGTSAITVAPNNKFLYVSTAAGIYLYTIGSTGALTLGNGGSAIATDQAVSLQVDKNNEWLVEVASGDSNAYALPIDSSTGLLTSTVKQYVALPASTARQVAIAPDDSYVFVAMGTGGTATIPFTAGNTNPFGTVSTIAPVGTGGAAQSVAVDPIVSGQTAPRLFYIGETVATSGSNTGGLRVFNYSTFAELTGSPLATQGLAPYSILPKSTGDYVYVANRQVSGSSTGVIAGYSISASGTTYTVTALSSTTTAGTHPVALAEENEGNYLLAVNYDGSPDLLGFTFDSTTGGKLDKAISSATGTDPVQACAIAATH